MIHFCFLVNCVDYLLKLSVSFYFRFWRENLNILVVHFNLVIRFADLIMIGGIITVCG